jgi:uncharacterized glyoxalase superfamily protein PhnB
MLRNRTVPVDTVLPHITYKNLPEAIEWLTSTLGFVEHFRYGDPVSGAQLRLANAWVMVRQARGEYRTPAELGFGTQSVTVFLENVEEHYARLKAAGVTIVEDLHETEYGEFQYAITDLEGHHWLFSRHARDMSPDAWGATLTNPGIA